MNIHCRGVVIATAHIRGGGEGGRKWHQAGAGENKWASMYDYAAALNHMLSRGVTQPGCIVIDAFSAGALVAASALAARPDVFAAAVLQRPFVALYETMSDNSLPLTAHEYDEWGGGEYASSLARWQRMCPHQNLSHARCAQSV